MSKSLEASCVGGIVTADNLPVASAEILSEGVAPSTGTLILDEDRAFYVAKTSPDLKTTLTQLTNALTQLTLALTILDSKPIGVLPPVPAATANIAAITAANTALMALKEFLK